MIDRGRRSHNPRSRDVHRRNGWSKYGISSLSSRNEYRRRSFRDSHGQRRDHSHFRNLIFRKCLEKIRHRGRSEIPSRRQDKTRSIVISTISMLSDRIDSRFIVSQEIPPFKLQLEREIFASDRQSDSMQEERSRSDRQRRHIS